MLLFFGSETPPPQQWPFFTKVADLAQNMASIQKLSTRPEGPSVGLFGDILHLGMFAGTGGAGRPFSDRQSRFLVKNSGVGQIALLVGACDTSFWVGWV